MAGRCGALSTPSPHTEIRLPREVCGLRQSAVLPGENWLKREMWQLDAKQDPRLGLDCGETPRQGLFQGNWQNVTMDQDLKTALDGC